MGQYVFFTGFMQGKSVFPAAGCGVQREVFPSLYSPFYEDYTQATQPAGSGNNWG
jgi:hypothetical protein